MREEDDLKYDRKGRLVVGWENASKISFWRVMTELCSYNRILEKGDVSFLEFIFVVIVMVGFFVLFPIMPIILAIDLKIKARRESKKRVYEILKK